mmetsp:Transcript_28134/g.42555  ORF Transcript_28134/g.42555 Transcript_28134/m.42555 type:complete len:110 (-) Transcript_28134:2476-2805(-)
MSSCTLDLEDLTNEFGVPCQAELQRRISNSKKSIEEGFDPSITEPILIGGANCITDIEMPFSGATLKREDFGLLIVLIDFLVILSLVIFIFLLDRAQNKYITHYYRQTI